MGLIFIVAGMIPILIAFYLIAESRRIRQSWMRVPSTVEAFTRISGPIESAEPSNSPDPTHPAHAAQGQNPRTKLRSRQNVLYPVLRVMAPQGSRLQISPSGSSNPLLIVGQTVDVFVNPQDPEYATQLRGITGIAIAFAVMGGVCVLVGAAQLRLDPFNLTMGLGFTLLFFGRIFFSKDGRGAIARMRALQGLGRGLSKRLLTDAEYHAVQTGAALGTSAYLDSTASVSPIIQGVQAQSALPQQFTHKPPKPKDLRPSAFLLLAIAVGLGMWGWRLLQEREAFLARAERGAGVVVGLKTGRSSGRGSSTTYAPIVSYVHPSRALPYEFTHPVSSNPPGWSRGESVRVYFDPQDPQNAILDTGALWVRFPALGMLIFAGLLALAGVGILRAAQRARAQPEPYATYDRAA